MNQRVFITVQNTVTVPIHRVWELWNRPEHIVNWAFASDDWEAPHAENDVRVGGKFKIAMAAKDKGAGFDFTGVYTNVKENKLIEYAMDDGRRARVEFTEIPEGTRIVESFEPEKVNPEEMQRSGWQAILDNFKKYAEIQNWIKNLENEGFTDVRVCPIPPSQDLPEHTHEEYTVHVILTGELIIVDNEGERVFHPGDRVEFPAGTTHKARGSIDSGTMIIGTKK